MKTNLKFDVKETLLEYIGDEIEPFLKGLPFKSAKDLKDALQFLAEEIESLDYHEIFTDLENPPDDFVMADEEE